MIENTGKTGDRSFSYFLRLEYCCFFFLVCFVYPFPISAGRDISGEIPSKSEVISFEEMNIPAKAKDKAEAMTMFANVLVSLRNEKTFSKKTVESLLDILERDPEARLPLQLLLASWADKKGDFYEQSLIRLVPIAEKHPETLKLNMVAVLGLAKKKRYDEGIRLLENVVDKIGYDDIGENDKKLYVDSIITLSSLYEKKKQYDKGDRLFTRFRKNEKFRSNFDFTYSAILFYSQAADKSDNKTFFWFSEGAKDKYKRKLNEYLSLMPTLVKDVKLRDLATLLELLRQNNAFEKGKSMILNFLLGHPDNHSALLLLAAIYNDLKEYHNAYRIWKKLITNEKSNENYYLSLGNSAMLANRYEDAVEAYEWYLAFKPNDRRVLYQLAYAYFELREYHKAINKLKKLQAVPDGLFLTALAYRNLDDFQNALKYLQMTEKLAKKEKASKLLSKNFYLSFAFVAEKAGNLSEAERVLTDLLKKYPNDAEIENFLGYILADHNMQLDRAEKLVLSALRKKQDCRAYLDSLAWVYYRQKKFKEAAAYIDKALVPENDEFPDPVIIDHAGDIYLALGDTKKAIHLWETAIGIYSSDIDYNKILEKIDRYSKK